MGKFTISMAIFNSYVKLPEGIFPIFTPEIHQPSAPPVPSAARAVAQPPAVLSGWRRPRWSRHATAVAQRLAMSFFADPEISAGWWF